MRDMIHMSASEREAYAAWLKRIAGTKRGTLSNHLRNAARELRQQGDF